MKLLFVLLVFFLVGFPEISNSLYNGVTPRLYKSRLGIYDGKITTPDKYPFVVALFYGGNFICAGAIVSESWVITVANCVNTTDAANLTVLAGSDDAVNGTVYDVTQVVLHPSYDSTTYDYNYAVVQVQGEFSWSNITQPASLPSDKICSFSSLTVVGYGQTKSSSSGSSGGQLREGSMNWYPRSLCKSMYETQGISLTDRISCAYNAAKTTLCTGDLADPLVKDGVLYGQYFHAASMGFCGASAPAVLVTDILPVTAWISNTTGASYDTA